MRDQTDPAPSQRRAVRLRAAHTVALLLVAVTCALGPLLTRSFLLRYRDTAPLTNVSGRQRMLCERIAKESVLVAADPSAANRTALLQTLGSWTTMHRALATDTGPGGGAAFGPLPGEAYPLLQRLEPAFAGISRAAESLLLEDDPQRRAVLSTTIVRQTRVFVDGMEDVVQQIQRETFESVERARATQLELLLLVFALLGATAFWIFRPVVECVEQELAQRLVAQQRLSRRNQQLRRALAKARSATRTRATFLASMNHELRTPLNGVIGNADLLEQTALDDSQRELAHIIRRSAALLSAQIDDILDLSHLSTRPLKCDPIEFDLRDIVHEACRRVMPDATHKGLFVAAQIDLDVPRLARGDGVRLLQVLAHLVHNAMKFTDEGDVLVRVSNAGDGRLRFDVSDSGIGIAEQDLALVFKPFHQVDCSPTRRHGGSGLGLALCRRLVEEQEGAIGAESRPGEGSRFWFVLPFTPCGGEESPTRLAGVRALVTLADARRLNHVVGQLKMLGASVRSSPEADPHGAEAQEHDVVICDATRPAGIGDARWVVVDGGEMAADRCGWPLHERTFLAAIDAAVSTPAKPPRAAAAPAEARHLAVLLVEDNPINQRVGAALLRNLGHRVDIATDGGAAVRALEEQGYDLVLMDLHMPGMDGFEATRRIRASRAIRQQPRIVALTADVRPETRRRCTDVGMTGFLRKPIDRAALACLLRECAPRPQRAL